MPGLLFNICAEVSLLLLSLLFVDEDVSTGDDDKMAATLT